MGTENLAKLGRVVFEICVRTDRQTDRQTDRHADQNILQKVTTECKFYRGLHCHTPVFRCLHSLDDVTGASFDVIFVLR